MAALFEKTLSRNSEVTGELMNRNSMNVDDVRRLDEEI